MSVHLRSTASPLASFLRTERHSRQFADMAVVAGAARVEAHRLALAASSTFFQGVLARCRRKEYPVVCLQGVQHFPLILDFIYQGEVEVAIVDLPAFLEEARQLGVQGLLREEEETPPSALSSPRPSPLEPTPPITITYTPDTLPLTQEKDKREDVKEEIKGENNEVKTVVEVLSVEESEEELVEEDLVANGEGGGYEADFNIGNMDRKQELNQTLASMLEEVTLYGEDGVWLRRFKCLQCGKLTKQKTHAMEHCEVHLDLNNPCKVCGKSYRSRSSLYCHLRKVHDIMGISPLKIWCQ